MRKMLTTESHDIEVSMSGVLCNILSLTGRQDITDIITFVIVRCRQVEIFKKSCSICSL